MSKNPPTLITIKHSDLRRYPLVVIQPEDLGAPKGRTITLRRENLPVVPYIQAVPLHPVRITPAINELRLLERRMLGLVNADRDLHGDPTRRIRPLEWDDAVADVARQHSEDMLARRFFAHVNPSGMEPQDRLRRAGVAFLTCGENIAGTPTMRGVLDKSPEEKLFTGYPSIELAEDGLMNSPGHRRNILESRYTHAGIGIVSNPDGTLIITQNFITRVFLMD